MGASDPTGRNSLGAPRPGCPSQLFIGYVHQFHCLAAKTTHSRLGRERSPRSIMTGAASIMAGARSIRPSLICSSSAGSTSTATALKPPPTLHRPSLQRRLCTAAARHVVLLACCSTFNRLHLTTSPRFIFSISRFALSFCLFQLLHIVAVIRHLGQSVATQTLHRPWHHTTLILSRWRVQERSPTTTTT